jgi:hypothetical protein
MSSNRIPPRGPHPPPDSLLFQKQKLVPISLVPWNPSSTPSTSKRPSTSSNHPTAYGRCRWGGDGNSSNDGSSSNGYDARKDGGARLYACSDGSWTCFVWWTDDGWTWVCATGVGTAATDVSGAYAASTSESTSSSAPSSTPSATFATTLSTTSSCAATRRPCPTPPQQTTDVSRAYSSRDLLGPPSITTTPLHPTRFETISLFSPTTPCRTKWIWATAW